VTVEEWAERYARAWMEADDDAAGALFTDDATYRSDPFHEPHRGRDAIRRYWREVTATQANVEVAVGRPVVVGRRAVVEWWTQMDSDGTPVTLPGALILDFDEGGLCRALREYWNLEVGTRLPPFEGWGS
jgi:ketosteroid isomerase-like protein